MHHLFFGRRFSESLPRRLLVLFEPKRIPYTSAYPLLFYKDQFASQHGVDIRFLETQQVLDQGIPDGLSSPTHVIAQSWLTDAPSKHEALAQLLEKLSETGATTAYSDTFANCDIRLYPTFNQVDYYFKKSLFADRQAFLRPTYGHTNLSDFYGKLYGMTDEDTDWQITEDALPKLRIAPNFLSNPSLMSMLLNQAEPPQLSARDIDVHARLGGIREEGWYGEMRRHAEQTVKGLGKFKIVSGPGVKPRAFMKEMRDSKICFSPFGYGELCWRDVEAIITGAVMIKPDMSHLQTEPNLYIDGETYIACRWDFADLEEKIADLLADDDKRHRIAKTAHQIARQYLIDTGPVSTYGALFDNDRDA